MGLIINGVDYPVPDVKVVNWRESGLTWKLGQSGTRIRQNLWWWVWHWTGGDPSKIDAVGARGCYNTLTSRGLSIQLFLGYTGVVYQYVDLAWGCAHAGSPTNDHSIGIEMQNVGHGTPNPKVPRARLPETIHSAVRPTSQFTSQQLIAAQRLREFVGRAYDLGPATLPDADTISLARRNKHRGDLAHYQISDAKRDPGTHFMEHVTEWSKAW